MENCYFSIIFYFATSYSLIKIFFKGYFEQKQDVAHGKTDNNQQNDKNIATFTEILHFIVISLSFS